MNVNLVENSIKYHGKQLFDQIMADNGLEFERELVKCSSQAPEDCHEQQEEPLLIYKNNPEFEKYSSLLL